MRAVRLPGLAGLHPYQGRTDPDPDKAGADVEQLLLMRPNFRQRGHWFITRYVKFEELVDRIADGLEKVGLRLE